MENKIEIKPILNFYSKEIQIMRQSQQKMAFDYSKSKGYIPSILELQRMTNLFVEVCLRPQDDDLTKRINALDKWLNNQVQKKMDKIEIDGILI